MDAMEIGLLCEVTKMRNEKIHEFSILLFSHNIAWGYEQADPNVIPVCAQCSCSLLHWCEKPMLSSFLKMEKKAVIIF